MKRTFFIGTAVLLASAFIGYGANTFFLKYRVSHSMRVPIEERSALEYIEDPALHSLFYERYGNRTLHPVKKSPSHFNFIFESKDPQAAVVSLQNIDLSFFIPTVPSWVIPNPELTVFTLVEREWNRQQEAFNPEDENVSIKGGDGFEKEHITSIELAKNCLNAGLFEIFFFSQKKTKIRPCCTTNGFPHLLGITRSFLKQTQTFPTGNTGPI